MMIDAIQTISLSHHMWAYFELDTSDIQTLVHKLRYDDCEWNYIKLSPRTFVIFEEKMFPNIEHTGASKSWEYSMMLFNRQ